MISDTDYCNIFLGINFRFANGDDNIFISITPFGYSFEIRYNEGGQFWIDGTQIFYDSLIVNNKTYYEVVEKIETSRSILYNKTDGILQVCDKNKELFSIIK